MFRRMKFIVLLVLALAQSRADRQADPVCKGADIKLFTDNRLPATLYRNSTQICIWNSTGSRNKDCEERVLRDEMHNIRLYNCSTDDTGVYTLMVLSETVGNKTQLISGECNVAATESSGIYGIYRIFFGIMASVCVLSLGANIVFIPLYWRLRKRQYSKVKKCSCKELDALI